MVFSSICCVCLTHAKCALVAEAPVSTSLFFPSTHFAPSPFPYPPISRAHLLPHPPSCSRNDTCSESFSLPVSISVTLPVNHSYLFPHFFFLSCPLRRRRSGHYYYVCEFGLSYKNDGYGRRVYVSMLAEDLQKNRKSKKENENEKGREEKNNVAAVAAVPKNRSNKTTRRFNISNVPYIYMYSSIWFW